MARRIPRCPDCGSVLARRVKSDRGGTVTLYTECPVCDNRSVDCIIERRSFPRHDAEVPVRFTFSGRTYEGHTLNLSESGMAMRSNTQLPKGHTLSVDLMADGVPPISVVGEVVWSLQVAESSDGGGKNGRGPRYDSGLMLLRQRIDPGTFDRYRSQIGELK